MNRCNDWDDPIHAFKVAGPAENDDIGREKAPKPIVGDGVLGRCFHHSAGDLSTHIHTHTEGVTLQSHTHTPLAQSKPHVTSPQARQF